MQLLGWGRIAPQVGWSYPLHQHDDYHELIVVLQGRLETKILGQTITSKKGDVLCYPQSAAHVERAMGSNALELLFAGFQADLRFKKDASLVQFDMHGRIEHQVRWLIEEGQASRSPDQEFQNALMLSALREYQRLALGTESAVVLDVTRYVQSRLPAAITLDELARHVGLSKSYFARMFHAASGQSPIAFVRKLRVEAARALVLRTTRPLKLIAADLGFADEFHFSRVFRAVTGVSPSSLRRGI